MYTPPELWQQYQLTPTVQLRNKILMQNQGLVRTVAKKQSTQCREPYSDLEQLGYLGLARAIERFNPDAGVKFSSFAVPYILGEMLHYLRDKHSTLRLDRRTIEAVGRVKRLARKCPQFSQDQIALACGITAEEWRSMQDAVKCKVISLDWHPIQIPAQEQEEIQEMQGRALQGLAYLPAQMRECVLGRYVLNLGDAQIARQQGMEVDQVQSVIDQGLSLLRQEIVTDAAC